MAANTAVSLFFYLRLIQPMYFGPAAPLVERRGLRSLEFVFTLLAIGTLIVGVLPQTGIARRIRRVRSGSQERPGRRAGNDIGEEREPVRPLDPAAAAGPRDAQ
jgi:hypothetical protein